jgi:hypothetical protein
VGLIFTHQDVVVPNLPVRLFENFKSRLLGPFPDLLIGWVIMINTFVGILSIYHRQSSLLGFFEGFPDSVLVQVFNRFGSEIEIPT